MTKLLLPAPRQRTEAEFWRLACVGVAIMGAASAVGGYGLGAQHARSEFAQQVKDAEYYEGLLESCAATVERATHAGEQAARLLRQRRALQSWVLHLTSANVEHEVSR